MPRTAKPWYREQDGWWYTTIDGKQVKLAQGKANKKRAGTECHRLLGQSVKRGEMDSKTVAVLCDTYLEHCKAENVKEAYEYKVNILTQFSSVLGRKKCEQLIPNHVSSWVQKQKHWG